MMLTWGFFANESEGKLLFFTKVMFWFNLNLIGDDDFLLVLGNVPMATTGLYVDHMLSLSQIGYSLYIKNSNRRTHE